MSQIINTNVLSLNAQRNLNSTQGALSTSLERLSSGLRINSAKDDAAGLAIAERFTSQIRGLDQAQRNANDGISFAQTAEGALGEIGNALQRVRELSVQAANDSNSSTDRQALNNEVQQLISEVGRIANSTQFNGQNILDGSLSDLVFQVGANRNQTISVDGVDSRSSQLGAQVAEGASALLGQFTDGLDLAALDGDSLTIQGVAIDLTDLDGDASSFAQVVERINLEAAQTGVTASIASEIETSLTVAAATDDGTLTLNGVNIAINNGDGAEEIANAINALSTQSGVSAEEVGGELVLQSQGDIDVSIDGGGTIDIGGLTTGQSGSIFRGVELAGAVGTDIQIAGTAADVTALGLDAAGSGDARALTTQDVLTRQGATDTIQVADFALQQVNGLRAELGAVQIRFESTIANLSVGSENLQGARSRIQDADFAAETAALTRAQILQQAGTSVLAQANAVPQNVLALLG